MIILTKKRFGFVKQDGTERIDAERFLTKGGMEIEDAPNWIATDPLYALAVESGDLVPVSGKTPKLRQKLLPKPRNSPKRRVKANKEVQHVPSVDCAGEQYQNAGESFLHQGGLPGILSTVC